MSQFRYYNVKLTGRKAQIKDIGVEGYKKIFDLFSSEVKSAFRHRLLHDLAFALKGEMFFSALRISSEDKFATGKFIKFDQPDSIRDLYTGQNVLPVKVGVSAHRFEFLFVFDYETHILAIENSESKLPSSSQLQQALEHLLFDHAATFPDHVLEVIQLASSDALKDVFQRAEKYRKVDVYVSVSNSDRYTQSLAKSISIELKKNGISKMHHLEQAEQGGYMSAFSKQCAAYLVIAKKNGDAIIRYFDKTTKKLAVYSMKQYPYLKSFRRKKEETERDYAERVLGSIKVAHRDATK